MHYNKTKEHAKAFKSIGKFPKTLLNVHSKLKYIITQYSKLSQDTNILPLYCIDPNSHTIFGQSIYITDNIKQKLYILSNIALKKFLFSKTLALFLSTQLLDTKKIFQLV